MFGLIERADRIVIEPGRLLRPAARDGRHLGQSVIDLGNRHTGIAPGTLNQLGSHALAIVQQRLQQMRRRDPLVIHADSNRLRSLQKAFGPVGELFEIHEYPRVITNAIWCDVYTTQ